jgi:hypothetical protein
MSWLSAQQLIELTKYKRPSKQRQALNTMGIDYVTRPDGTVVVFESDLGVNLTNEKTKNEFKFYK